MTDSAGKTPPTAAAARIQAGARTSSSALRTSERFPKSTRIHSSIEFDVLFKLGKVQADPVLVMHARLATGQVGKPGQAGRIGISISKRVGHAPLRNRWKRLIREAYRRAVARTPALERLDIVVRPRRGAVPTYQAIARSIVSLATRLDRQLNSH